MLARLGPICEGDTWPQRQTHSEGECEARGEGHCPQTKERPQKKPSLLTPDLGRLASETVRPSVSVVKIPQSVVLCYSSFGN